MTSSSKFDREQRWRLILGGDSADGIQCQLTQEGIELDRALHALYNSDADSRRGGLGSSAPKVARWLGDIRKYFKADAVRLIQRDAMEKLKLQQLLLEPEMLEAVEPDVNLVANIISLSRVIPDKTKETARLVVAKVVDELMKKLETPMRSAVLGSLDKAARNNRPKHQEIDWPRTIKTNLHHYQEQYNTIIPQQLIGYGRKQRRQMKEIILCVDQSGSMATSVVYSSIFAAVMASIPAVKTRLILFDTEVVDLTEKLEDPVDVLFGTQLGGGTDIARAIRYTQNTITQPSDTILILITDLFEGGIEKNLLKRVAAIVNSGVQLITLLALNDEGTPCFNTLLAKQFAELGVPSFACTPAQFPDLMAAAIQNKEINIWAAENNIVIPQTEEAIENEQNN